MKTPHEFAMELLKPAAPTPPAQEDEPVGIVTRYEGVIGAVMQQRVSLKTGDKLYARPQPKAQEDEPVYQLNVGPDKWWDVNKEAFDQVTIDAPQKRILYARPSSDELRRAAEEFISWFDGEEYLDEIAYQVDSLRAALEKK
jgi:hypothetical protein